jgi:hypothetical protein
MPSLDGVARSAWPTTCVEDIEDVLATAGLL